MRYMIDEKFWQDLWQSEKIFETEPDEREKFLITVPWPYTSGPLHVGHGRTYTIADIMARFLRMQGLNVLFPMGFHESGTPIGSISHKIESGDRKTLDLYRKYVSQYDSGNNVDKVLSEFVDPIKVADYFAEKIINDFKALGFSIDWRRKFRSIEPNFSQMVKWQFRELGRQEKLKKGSHPVLFSIMDGNAVGEDDIEDGDTDKVSIEKFQIVLFQADNEEIYLGAGSLRTETIFGITNLWYNPEIKYVLMKIQNRKIVVSAFCAQKIMYQFEGSEVLGDVNLEEFSQKIFRVPITGKRIKIFKNPHVKEGQATGIVFSVPGHSVMDFSYLQEFNLSIEPIEIIEIKGIKSSAKEMLKRVPDRVEANLTLYRDEYYDGKMDSSLEIVGSLSVINARDKMSTTLKDMSLGFDFYECSREARTRDGKPVIVAVIHDQWFIDYAKPQWKSETLSQIEDMNFKPEFYKGNMVDIINWLEERACARKRGLGTRLPQQEDWVIESLSDSTIYPAYYTFSHLIKNDNEVELNDDFFDYVLQGKIATGYKPTSLAKSCRKSFQYWYGVDRRITSSAHMSNHLAFYIFNHVAIFDQKYQPKGISIAGMVISNGAKISKSKGNAVSLLDVVKTHGADIFRLYVALVAEMDSTLDWNEKEVENIHGVYRSLNTIFSSIPQKRSVSNIENAYMEIFLARFEKHLNNYTEKMRTQQVRGACVEIVYEVLKDLSELSAFGLDQNFAAGEIVERWLKALSPIVPHMTDHYWKQLGNETLLERETLEIRPLNQRLNDKLIHFEYVKELIKDIRDIMNVTRIIPTAVEIILCGDTLAGEIGEISKGNMNIKNKQIIGPVKKFKGKIQFGINESAALKEFGHMIESAFACQLNVKTVDFYTSGKLPMPGRPTIKLSGDINE